MCGICCRLSSVKSIDQTSKQLDARTIDLLHSRGPNKQSESIVSNENFKISFNGFVLWQQGESLCQQPSINEQHILLLNGDIFSKRCDYSKSDTEWLLKRIGECEDNEDRLIQLFQSLEGPYSIVLFNKKTQKLYFVRDSLGRQSLLLAKYHDGDIVISSVLASNKEMFSTCFEVPAVGLFCFDLKNDAIRLNSWHTMDEAILMEQISPVKEIFEKQITFHQEIQPFWMPRRESPYSYNFERLLSEHINSEAENVFNELLKHKEVTDTCSELLELLKKSIIDRSRTPPFCRTCLLIENSDLSCKHAKVGILFSGGIDCTILATLLDKIVNENQPIDLINVSFEKIDRSKVSKTNIDYNTPDRISARDSLKELIRMNAKRQWNLVEVNVTRDELSKALKERIIHLIYPLTSVLDSDLAAVLWFGARGQEQVNGNNYHSACRVLLIGSGADELFGGYTRHRNAFIRQYPDVKLTPFERLERELEFDFHRLPSRNLARDDRVIGDCGITARSPFLEENFVHFIRNLNASQKCYPALKQGIGEKLLLRLCGYQLGLREVTSLKKRAMQFGSRVADRKQNAEDTAEFL